MTAVAFIMLRFDFRNPPFAETTMAERYAAALDMAAWADRLDLFALVLSEHHGSADGYLPSPLPFAAAVAARTGRIRINIAAILAPFHDPLRLAEDLAVVDNLAPGRLELVIANGYVPDEFEMFGVPMDERPARTTEAVGALKAAWTGEPFEFRGRTVQVTPAPATPGGPPMALGGGTAPAARRAARLGLQYQPAGGDSWEAYRAEWEKLHGTDVGPYLGPPKVTFTFLAEDVEAGWAAIAPYALHETNAYGEWAERSGAPSPYFKTDSIDELRAAELYRVATPKELTEELAAAEPFGFAMLHPMMGGIPPALAWASLHLLEREVLPNLPG
jgi:alkanesulfonate monooxygenase SsuD/methylene tetrahydromethanopterin reductase-like flavin-dependent oxidoreductase (luciferase family)